MTGRPPLRGFYVILSEEDYRLHRHDTLEQGVQEARRLANVSPGTAFFVMEARCAAVRDDPVKVVDVECDDLPF